MRREGWQHGAMRSSNGVKTTAGPAEDDDAKLAPSVGKPTNHSKFTGKCKRARCGTCHSHPVSKSRDKAKGAHKLRSGDVALNHRLVSWRVAAEEVGSARRSKCSGFSATAMLDRLLASERDCRDDDDDDGDECRSMDGSGDDVSAECGDAKEEEEEEEYDDVGEEFCQVGIVWEYIDGGDWCLVHEMT